MSKQLYPASPMSQYAQIALAIRDTTAPYPDLRTWWDVYRWWLAQGKEN